MSPALQEDIEEPSDENVGIEVQISAENDESLYVDLHLIDVATGPMEIPPLQYEDEVDFEHESSDDE